MVLPRNEVVSTCFSSSHFTFWRESGLISSNSHNLFRANITFRTRSNSTKKLQWLFKRDYCANYFTYFFIAQLIFYPKPTVIYVLVFLPVSFYEKTFISLSNITKPSLKNISLIIVSFLFSFKLKIIPNYRSRCVSISFSERIDSYPIHLVSLSESERSNPSLLWKSCRKKSVPMETESLSDMNNGTER